MKHRIKDTVDLLALLLLGILLFAFPEVSSAAAQDGISLCLHLLIPSLFPFFVLSSLLIATGMVQTCVRPLSRFTNPIFGTGSAGTSAFLLGIVGGYPVGARTLSQLVQRGECPQEEALRLSLFCNNCGPAFFIGAAGVGVFGSKTAGFLLLAANFVSALLLAVFLRIWRGKVPSLSSRSSSSSTVSLLTVFPDCVNAAFSSTLSICAYVILFSVLTALVEASGILPCLVQTLSSLTPVGSAPGLWRSFLMGLLELSTGTASLQAVSSSPAALPLAAFLLGWGGFSVHCQSLPFWREANIPAAPYLAAKLTQGILAALITVLAAPLLPLSLPAMAPTTVSLPSPSLLQQEMLALWGLAGGYFCLFGKKGVEKTRKSRYNNPK